MVTGGPEGELATRHLLTGARSRSRKRLSTYLGRPSPTITQRRDDPPRTQVSLDFQRPREHDIDKKKCFERVNRGIEIQSNLAFLNECLARHGG